MNNGSSVITVTRKPDTTLTTFAQDGDVLSTTETAGMAYATMRGLLECGFTVSVEGGEPLCMASANPSHHDAAALVHELFRASR